MTRAIRRLLAGGINMHAAKIRKCAKIAVVSIALLSSGLHAQELDEVAQLKKFKAQLGAHMDESNTDTRFIVDRNNRGVFKQMRNVGIVQTNDTITLNGSKVNVIRNGTGIILNDCYAITSYHVVEGQEILMNSVNKIPWVNRAVNFYFGPISGTHIGFSQKISGTVVDPGILNLSSRSLSDDIVLIRFSKKLPAASFEGIEIGSIYGKRLNKSDTTNFNEQFFTSAGYPASKMTSLSTAALYVDFCNPKESVLDLGITTNCVITARQSGGPFMVYERIRGTNKYLKILIGINSQSSDESSGLFEKKSDARSVITTFRPAMIEKIKMITDKNLDGTCH